MDKNTQKLVVASINTFTSAAVIAFLDDYKNKKEELLNFAITLKHWANPLGHYFVALSAEQVEKYFTDISIILSTPERLLGSGYYICFMPSHTQPGLLSGDMQSVERKLYLESKENTLKYMFVGSSGKIETSRITLEELKRENKEALKLNKLKLLLPDIVSIISKKDPACDPKLAELSKLNSREKKQIYDMVCIKLETIANRIIEQCNFDAELKKRLVVNPKTVMEWWDSKSREEKKRIETQFHALGQQSRAQLKLKVAQVPKASRPISTTFVPGYINPFYFYCMSNNFASLSVCNYLGFSCFGSLLFLGTQVTANIANAVVQCMGSAKGGNITVNSSSVQDQGQMLAVMGVMTLILSGLVGGLYALKKAFNSFINFFTGNKMLRSLYRFSGIGAGGYFGGVGGALAGALLGSAIPGFGTVAGAIVGAIFGSGLGAGLAALLTKYSAKLISVIFYKNELNPSNPEKLKLSKKQLVQLKERGMSVNQINKVLLALQAEKNALGVEASLPWSKARKQKNAINGLIKKVRNGDIPPDTTITVGRTKFNLFKLLPRQMSVVSTQQVDVVSATNVTSLPNVVDVTNIRLSPSMSSRSLRADFEQSLEMKSSQHNRSRTPNL